MWFRNKRVSRLPSAKGPFLPGCMDVMTEYSKDGFFIRLYYPTEKTGDINDYKGKWIPWSPDVNYIDGFGKVVRVMSFFVRFVVWWTSGCIQIPTLYGEKVNKKNKLKPIIFSHGLGANRFLYSAVCNELASRGYLVATLEHRDGSASFTYYYENEESAKNDRKTVIDFVNIEFGKDHYVKRNEQILKRFSDCEKVLDFLISLNSGIVPHNVIKDTPTTREINFDLSDLIGNIDVDDVTMSGHSFGGATALYTISKREEFKQCFVLDPWMFPIKDEESVFKTTKPILFINTQTFHIFSNVEAMKKLLNSEDRQMFTILNTTHESQSDTVFVIGYWLNWFMEKLEPEVGIEINNCLLLRFLRNYTPTAELNVEDCEKVLEEHKKYVSEGLTKPWA